jgi:uncharacterized repeat protein (TIGR01451 family)
MDRLARPKGYLSRIFSQLLRYRAAIKHNIAFRSKVTGFAGILIGTLLSPLAAAQTTTFNYTGAMQTYTVPAGAAGVLIQASGGGGGGGGSDSGGPGASGGSGATVTGSYTVAAGTPLSIYVGGGGGGGFTSHAGYTCTSAAGSGGSGAGGFAGGMGGQPGCSGWSGGGGGGGGASVVATSANASLLIAGGGGGGQGGSLTSSSVPSVSSTQAGALPGSAGATGQSETQDGGGGGGGGGGCPGGVAGEDHNDSTGTHYNLPAGAGSSCYSPGQITAFAISAASGGAGGAGAPAGGTNAPAGGAGAAGSISLTPFYNAVVVASANFPAAVNAGQTVSGSVTFTNNGPSIANGDSYGLTLAANLSTTPTLSGLPPGVTYSYAAATGAITLSGMPATLAAGASLGPIMVSYTQPPSGTSAVTATVSTTTTDLNPAAGTVTATIGGSPVATVLSTLSFPANVNAGQAVSGTLTYSNTGPSTATGDIYSLTLAANLAAPPTLSGLPTGASYTYNAATGVISMTGMPPTLAAGAALAAITVNYLQPPSGNSSVTATFTTTTLDPNPAAGTATATIGGSMVATVLSSASFPATVNAGLPVSGTVTFSNTGPSSSAGNVYTLTLPPFLAAAPTLSGLPAGAAYSYAPATGILSFTGMPASLSAGASLAPITVNYVQPPSGTSTLTATITTTTLDPNVPRGTVTVTVSGAAAQLSGTVYLDNNQDQQFDAGDTPIAGATVSLYAQNHLIVTVLASANGVYSFPTQAPGSYAVVVTPSSGDLCDTPASVTVTMGPGSTNVVNFGEIPKSVIGALGLSKTTPLVDISAGQSVPYTITATNSLTTTVANVTVTDLIPAGFSYRVGSGYLNSHKLEPSVNGRQLSWMHLAFAPGETKTFSLVLSAGAGVVSGRYTNQATAYNSLVNQPISNVATASVQIVADPSFDCPDLIGKVFDDTNGNGIADAGEKGIAGVRLVTAQGLLVTTDAEGRYHITCPVIPDAQLGSNFIVKLDERTLPSGYRLTSENPETVRLTAGKISKLNFGASISRVARIELSAAAFQAEALTPEVAQQLEALVAALKDETTIVRLSYAASEETDALIAARLQLIKRALSERWQARGAHAPLHFEEDIVRSLDARTTGAGTPP